MAIAALAACSQSPDTDPGNPVPLNLDFSRPGLVDPEVPWGWFLLPLSGAGVQSELLRDPSTGDTSLLLHRSQNGPEAQGIYFIDWDFGERPTLAVAAPVRIPTGSEAIVRLGMLAFDEDSLAAENWSSQPCGLSETDCRAVLTIPDDVESLQVLLQYEGRGSAIVSGLELWVDGTPYQSPFLPGQRGPEESDIAWVRRKAIPLASTDPDAELDDLAALKPLIGDAAWVLLGESTHGSREFFTLRHRLIRWLAEQEGFTVLAIEDHVAAARQVDDYVRRGVGDAAEVVRALFGVWERREIVDLVRWMREANSAARANLAFWGFDLQNPLGAIAELERFAADHAPELSVEVKNELGAIRSAWEEQPYPRRDREEFDSWARSAKRILDRMERLASEDGRPIDADRAVFNARLVWQSAELSRTGDAPLRDRFMSDNLSWIRDRQPPGTRIVVWAHNTHVRLDEAGFGGHLERRYPGQVVSFGLFTRRGEYTAYDAVRRRMEVYPLFTAPPGSVEALLARNGDPVFALDLRPARHESGAEWFRTPRLHRNIGLFPADLGFYAAPLAAGFHALLFVDRTTATRPIAAEQR